jgi:hypothetical protein
MASDLAKWRTLQELPARDAQQEDLRAVADALWAAATVSPVPSWAFVQLAACYARDCILYVTDTERVGREQIDGWPPDPYQCVLASVARGTDDCDAKGRLFVALCLAKGLQAKMMPIPSEQSVANGAPLTHVFGAVYAAHPVISKKHGWALQEGPKSWIPVETILARARPGDTAQAVPPEKTTGHWAYNL